MATPWTGAHCGSAACLLRAVNKGLKVTLRPNSFYHFVSVAEIAVVIRLRLGETRKSGKNADKSAHITCPITVCTICGIQSFPRQVSARHGRNTSAQPYRGMHMYASIHK